MAKKKSAKPKVSASMFKVTGAHAKMKIDQKKKKMFYFKEKVKPEKAMKNALKDGADFLEVSPDVAKASKPALKYEFYCIYDAVLQLKFLRLRRQELGVNDQVSGAFVGKEVILPKKGKTIPGRALHLELIELFELKRTDGMTVDGKTGGPADAVEKLLKGPGKKKATPVWIRSSKIASGKYNSIEKVVKTVAKLAGSRPSDAKRITEHSLTFNRLDGFYVPVYYVKVKAGEKAQTMRVNGLNGAVSLDI
ncbi:MAG: hypothetical protein ACFFAD_14150 [Candidatus Hermodarchaeota archaeon]